MSGDTADGHAVSDEARTVLVVDDFEDNRAMYAEFLKFSGYRVIEASDGLEAIQMATAFLPDLVVMDLSLPILDGWEATRRLKREQRTLHIPVVALTGHGVDAYSQRALEAGCDVFLAKPCLPETLLETVRRMLSVGGATARRDRVATERESGGRPFT